MTRKEFARIMGMLCLIFAGTSYSAIEGYWPSNWVGVGVGVLFALIGVAYLARGIWGSDR